MANDIFKRLPGRGKILYTGIDLRNPPDLQKPGRCPYLLNVTPDLLQGSIRPRSGISAYTVPLIGNTLPIHTIKRVNSELGGYAHMIGAGPYLRVSNTGGPFSIISPGFSGNPLSIVPFRPPNSPDSWAYVFDSLSSLKYGVNSQLTQNIGIFPPTNEPKTAIIQPLYKILDDTAVDTGWVASGSLSTVGSAARVSTTVFAVLYDAGPGGWGCIAPAGGGPWLTERSRVSVGGEYTTVEQVFAGFPATTVESVLYDIGPDATICTIVPTIPIQGITRNMLVQIGSNYTRVLSSTQGPDGLYSFRCSVAGATVGQTINIPTSFRCYTPSAHAVGAAILANSVSAIFALSGGAATGTGLLAKTVSLDLTQTNGRPLTTDDYMHVSILVDQPENVTEVHVLLDVDSATNDFNHNYFYYVLRQGDFTSSIYGGQTTLASSLNALTANIADLSSPTAEIESTGQSPYPAASIPNFSDPNADQLQSGAAAWLEATFHLSDLSRQGTDQTVGLQGVKAIGIAVYGTGSCILQIGGWYAGGTFGPDANYNSYGNQGIPVLYRYRYESLLTGAKSNPGPATRNGELPKRQATLVTVLASGDPQVDTIRIERNGGTFDTWREVAVVTNANQDVMDSTTESFASNAKSLELKQYPPFPVTDVLHKGTCNVSGTTVNRTSGDEFNPNWAEGSEIIINGQTYSLHSSPLTDSQMQIEQNIGALTGVQFQIPEATIMGQTLQFAWGPYDNRIFSCGDPFNPGRLYFTNSDNPDSAADDGYIDVTDPSEPLANGGVFEGANYVFSYQNLYRVEPTPGGVNPYQAAKLGSAYGIGAPWFFEMNRSPVIMFGGVDGVYGYSPQGGAESLTAEDLYPLFPHESIPGLPVSILGNSIYPPDYGQPGTLRISYADGQWFVDFATQNQGWKTFVYNRLSKGWVPYQYLIGSGSASGATLHYQEEGISNPGTLIGGADGQLYEVVPVPANYSQIPATDNGVPFPCVLLTSCDDQGETRAKKQYGDLIIDYAGLVGLTVFYNNLLASFTPSALSTVGERTQQIVNLGDNSQFYWNIACLFSWLSDVSEDIFEWQPSFIIKPEDTTYRPTDWMDAGSLNYKFVQGVRIHADTGGVNRTVQVQYDGGLVAATLTVNQNGELIVPYTFLPFKARMMRLVPQDPASWRLFRVDWVVNTEPDPVSYWVTQPTSFDLSGFGQLRDIQFAYAGNGIVSLVVDGTNYTLLTLPGSVSMTKQYIVPPALKGKVWQIFTTGTALQVYVKDCEFRVKSWGEDRFQSIRPIGEVTRDNGGARI